MKFKTFDQLSKLDNLELLKEFKAVKKEGNLLVDQLEDAKYCYEHILSLLKERLEDLQYDYLEAETDRLECDFSQLDIYTGIH